MITKVKSSILLGLWIFVLLLPTGVATAQVDLDSIKREDTTVISIEDLKRLKNAKETPPANADKPSIVPESTVSKTGWPALIKTMFSEYWVEFLALVVSVISVILAVSGYSHATKKKQKYLKKYLHDIDEVFTSYRMKSKRCEAELFRLEDQIEDRLKAGGIDENTFQLLEARIQKYRDEIKAIERGEGTL